MKSDNYKLLDLETSLLRIKELDTRDTIDTDIQYDSDIETLAYTLNFRENGDEISATVPSLTYDFPHDISFFHVRLDFIVMIISVNLSHKIRRNLTK